MAHNFYSVTVRSVEENKTDSSRATLKLLVHEKLSVIFVVNRGLSQKSLIHYES